LLVSLASLGVALWRRHPMKRRKIKKMLRNIRGN
jgi:hypothetical protein